MDQRDIGLIALGAGIGAAAATLLMKRKLGVDEPIAVGGGSCHLVAAFGSVWQIGGGGQFGHGRLGTATSVQVIVPGPNPRIPVGNGAFMELDCSDGRQIRFVNGSRLIVHVPGGAAILNVIDSPSQVTGITVHASSGPPQSYAVSSGIFGLGILYQVP